MAQDRRPTPHIPGNYHLRSHGLDGPDGPNAHVPREPFRLEIKYPRRGGIGQSPENIVFQDFPTNNIMEFADSFQIKKVRNAY